MPMSPLAPHDLTKARSHYFAESILFYPFEVFG